MRHNDRLERLNHLADTVALFIGNRKGVDLTPTNSFRKFDMSDWDCGTSACALGSYALTPFGSKFFKWDMWKVPALRVGDAAGFKAGAIHFGISEVEAEWLFDPDEYPQGRRGPTYVHKRIRTLIREYENPEI